MDPETLNAEPTAAAPAPTQEDVKPPTRAQAASRRLLEKSLSVEQRSKLKSTPAAADASESSTDDTTAKSSKASKSSKAAPAEEVHQFGDDTPAAATAPTEAPAAEDEALSDDEIAKLDARAQRIYREAQKEAAKVRKRAQEAEQKLADIAPQLAEMAKLKDLSSALEDVQARTAAMAGNSFANFNDGHAVAEWGESTKEAMALLKAHERSVKAGLADADDRITHVWPNGNEQEIALSDRQWLTERIQHAQAWFEGDSKVTANKEQAAKLVQKHSATKGFEEAHGALLKDGTIMTRIPELLAKAAYYDMMNSRRAVVTFPDAAGAAKNATTSAEGSRDKTANADRRRPPSETPASTPRMVNTESDSTDDIRDRKSQLMQQAMKATSPGEKQRLIKQAVMLGNPNRVKGR